LFLFPPDRGEPRSGWRIPLVSCRREPCEDDSHCTTGVQGTHKTCAREVAYRWHPLCGQMVWVRGEARRGGSVGFRCVQDELSTSAPLEIPEWMFDAGHCRGMTPGSLAYVSSSALLGLRGLLSLDRDRIESGVVQAQHLSSDIGGADADNTPIQSPTRRAVFSASSPAAAASGTLSGNASLVGADDERMPAEGPSPPRSSGGGR
jgi:hypothetical protein